MTREHKGPIPTRVRSESEVTMRESPKRKNKGNILQGPDYNKERRDKQVRSRDTGNGIVRSRQGMARG